MVVTQHELVASPRLHTKPDPRRARNPTQGTPSSPEDMVKQSVDHCGASLGHQSSSLSQLDHHAVASGRCVAASHTCPKEVSKLRALAREQAG